MKQILLGYTGLLPTNSATRYIALAGGNGLTLDATEANVHVLSPIAGTFRNLRVNLASAPGAAKSYAFTVMKNGSATSLTTTISGSSATENTDTSNSFTVSAGDTLSLRSVPSGTPTASAMNFSIEFESDTSNQYFMSSGISNSLNTTNSNYHPPVGTASSSTILSPSSEILIPHSTTIKALYVKLGAAPAAGKTWTFYIHKNGADEASSELILSNPSTTGNVTGLAISLSAGDRLSIRIIQGGTPASTSARVALLFESSVDGESILAANGINSSASGTYYGPILGKTLETASETGFPVDIGPTAFDVKNMYVRLAAAPGSAKTWTVNLRKNGADSGLATAITGAATTTGNETSTTVSYADGDTINLSFVGTSTPAVSNKSVSFVQYIAPSGGGGGAVAQRIYTLSALGVG